jgi:hypothetical protein
VVARDGPLRSAGAEPVSNALPDGLAEIRIGEQRARRILEGIAVT